MKIYINKHYQTEEIIEALKGQNDWIMRIKLILNNSFDHYGIIEWMRFHQDNKSLKEFATSHDVKQLGMPHTIVWKYSPSEVVEILQKYLEFSIKKEEISVENGLVNE
jgi:hypothetical protein